MTQSGGHRGERSSASKLPVLRLLLLLAGFVVLAVAWVVLVRAAIDFGADARAGRDEGWAFLVLASVGAIGCLLLALVLLVRGLMAVGLVSDSARASAGRHRG